jgi:hypothetical protein
MQSNMLGGFDLQKVILTGDIALDCLTLVERYEKKQYRIPDFQRQPLLWPDAQRQSFISRLRIGPAPIGTIVLFASEDDAERHTYLLDGLQRISTMWEFYHKPERYGISDKDIAHQFLHNAEFPVQRRTYPNQREAYADFLRLQANLHLTAYEENLGTRSLLPQWSWFSGIEDDLHKRVAQVIAGYGVREKDDRENAHNYFRHNLGMFLRYATANLTLEPWQVTGKIKAKAVETRLAELLKSESMKFSSATESLKGLYRRLDLDFAVIFEAWKEAKKAKGLNDARHMEITVIRFLHECGIYAHLNRVGPYRFKSFALQLLSITEGRGQVPYKKEGSAERVTLGLGKLGRLSDMARHTAVEEDIRNPDDKSDKSSGNYPIGRGQDRGHLLPKSMYGNGPTEPEPASLNRSKGNRITEEESSIDNLEPG